MNSTIKNSVSSLPRCPHQENCSGCQLRDIPYPAQEDLKTNELRNLFLGRNIHLPKNIQFLFSDNDGVRDRLDFSLEDGNLGLYQKSQRVILDLDICKQLSPALQQWLTEFRTLKFPYKKGSIRLRVGPRGEKGVWLDFANIDIKHLLEEKQILHFLQSQAFVEIGQRRKVPHWNGQEFKLKDPEHRPWFQTWVDNIPLDLFCQVASFTQPSHRVNKLICNQISQWLKNFPAPRLIEFGSGIGNLTFPALAQSERLVACEIDALSLEGLRRSLESLPSSLEKIKSRLEIHRGDFQKKILSDFKDFDGILANPPRSGLMNFLNPLEKLSEKERPPFFIYMSCFPESMAQDIERLQSWGYELTELTIVDQFPQTKHYEVLGLLQRK